MQCPCDGHAPQGPWGSTGRCTQKCSPRFTRGWDRCTSVDVAHGSKDPFTTGAAPPPPPPCSDMPPCPCGAVKGGGEGCPVLSVQSGFVGLCERECRTAVAPRRDARINGMRHDGHQKRARARVCVAGRHQVIEPLCVSVRTEHALRSSVITSDSARVGTPPPPVVHRPQGVTRSAGPL